MYKLFSNSFVAVLIVSAIALVAGAIYVATVVNKENNNEETIVEKAKLIRIGMSELELLQIMGHPDDFTKGPSENIPASSIEFEYHNGLGYNLVSIIIDSNRIVSKVEILSKE